MLWKLERPDPRCTPLASVAALLDTPHRRVAGGPRRVDLYRTGADAFGHSHCGRKVVGIHTARQTELALVGQRNRLVDVAIAQHSDHRTEDFVHRSRVVGRVDLEQRRLVKPTSLATGRNSPATDESPTRCHGIAHDAGDVVAMCTADEWADLCLGAGRVTDTKRFGCLADSFQNLAALARRDEQTSLQCA